MGSFKDTEFKKPSFNFPTEFPYEFDSFNFSSSPPDETFISPTENDINTIEEDEFLSGLTRRLTNQLTFKQKPEKWVMAGSPESTLSGIGSWSVSSNGSPNGMLSPPTTPFGAKNDTLDLIYAAAGQVAKLKMANEYNNNNKYSNACQESSFLGSFKETELKNHNTTHGFYSDQNFAHSVSQMNQYDLRARRECLLRQQCASIWARQQLQQQQLKASYQAQQSQNHQQPLSHSHSHCTHHSHHHQTHNRANGVGCVRPTGLTKSTWPPTHHHNQHSSSAVRTAFHGGMSGPNVAKKECAGTGVFLPRRYNTNNSNSNSNNTTEPKKKSGCSTVILPARVVQALNLNSEVMFQPRSNPASFVSDYELILARRNVLLAAQQQKRNLILNNHEVRLPQEWTY